MNVYDGIHWNIYEILPFQRNFNFINATRSIGKTYTTLLYIIDYCINHNAEYVYIVRTQDEKKTVFLLHLMKKLFFKNLIIIILKLIQKIYT